MNNLVPLVSIAIAAFALLVTVVNNRRNQSDRRGQEYTQQLEKRLEQQDKRIDQLTEQGAAQQHDLDACKQARDGFEDKNFQLLQEAYDNRKEIDALRRRVDSL